MIWVIHKPGVTAMNRIIVWFRQDLRLSDNPALFEAARTGAEIIPLYILDDLTPGIWKPGGASKRWLYFSLQSLSEDLSSLGLSLILRKGDPLDILKEVVKETKSSGIYWNRRYEPFHIEKDVAVNREFSKIGIECKNFKASLLLEPHEVSPKSGGYFKVFTPFWNSCLKSIETEKDLPVPSLIPYKKTIASEDLSDWKLFPRPDWGAEFDKNWTPGEKHAKKRLQTFSEKCIEEYPYHRDFPYESGTSLLSPHLHFGEISPRQIWNAVQKILASHPGPEKKQACEKYLSEIGWREFAHHLLYRIPGLPTKPFKQNFEAFPWSDNKDFLVLWQKGKTGYPIVDAGMRQLWRIGWMHNRVRMIVASFLTKHLLIHWIEGEKWFYDTLVDADLANNAAGWQWVAGCGADAAPYFRIFNPILQSAKFDPEGKYIKKWVPELANLPTKYIHNPAEAPEEELRKAGVVLGVTYPFPLVDLAEGRKKALELYSALN